jgi:4-amino-4-deoxy-L-arabinose transferase-like glycosyltransferase
MQPIPSVVRHPSSRLIVTVIIIFIVAGLTGHDPWKADEAYVFGIVRSMWHSGDWVVPMLAGEPFMEKPPLYYWAAAGFSYLFSGWLTEPDAARMTSGAFMLITCLALWKTAGLWWGNGVGRYAPLLLIACFGALTQTHMMMPDVPLLTGFALSAWGFATISVQGRHGGVWLGVGTGVAFLSKGLLGPCVIAITAMVLPLCFEQWRSRRYLFAVGIALISCLPWLTIWPLALYARSPTLFMDWFWENNLGRYFGFSPALSGTEHPPWFWLKTVPWFTFPTLPLALHALWKKRDQALRHPGMQYSLVAFSVLMLVLAMSSAARAVYALPVLVPLAILAAPDAVLLGPKTQKVWVWSASILFGFLSLFIWIGWGVMMYKHAPPDWRWLLRLLPSDFVPRFDIATLVIAVVATLSTLLVFGKSSNMQGKGLISWVIGLTLSWSLLSTLWMPWLDYAKSYRSVFVSMPVPSKANCIVSIGLGESERAMLRYVTGHITIRHETVSTSHCNTFLVQGYSSSGTQHLDLRGWEKIWEGARPGDSWQRFWLFRSANLPNMVP